MSSPTSNVPARRDSVELDHLAGEIRREHEAAQDAFRSAVEHAIRCGEMLIEAKASVPHGGWGDWIAENFPASKRTAQGYMRLARAEDAQALAHLGIEGALKQLAAPKQSTTADDLAPEPRREDYGEDHLEQAKFQLDKIAHAEDRQLALYRDVVANASEWIADDPAAGSAFVAKAATGIEFLTAMRTQEQTEGDREWAEAFKKAGKAWRVHRQARDAWYAAIDEPLMDERPLDFFDVFYAVGEVA